MRTRFNSLFILLSFLFICLIANATNYAYNESTKTFSLSPYANNESNIWDINTTVNTKPVKITFSLGSETNYDFLKIYSIDASGNPVLLESFSGPGIYRVLYSAYPTGKIRVVFTSDVSVNSTGNPSYWGFTLKYEVDNSYQINSDLKLNGALTGNQANGALRVQTGSGYLDMGAQNPDFVHFNTDLPNFLFNKPVYSSSNAFSSATGGDLKLQTGGATKITVVNSTGNVGIGTTAPTDKLSVSSGELSINSGSSTNNSVHQGIKLWTDNSPYFSAIRANRDNYSSQTGLSFFTANTATPTEKMRINYKGQVGIGTTTPDSLLTVNGGIHAKSVTIDLNGPLADYVFEPEYDLMPLRQVESFITQNNHLPEIPSAGEVKNKGMDIAQMQNKLLQKIEELTLYVIQQQKEIDALNNKLDEKHQ